MGISASVAFSFESGSHRHDYPYPGILHAGVENGAGLTLNQEEEQQEEEQQEEEQQEEDFEVAHRLSGMSRG